MLLASLVSALLWWQPAAATNVPLAPRPAAGYADPCKLFGTVYLERDPRRRGFCSATVFVEQQEAFANLVVYQEANKLFADKSGLWYLTDARDFADFTVLVTENRAFADFGIYYTKVRSFAGCRKD